MVVFLVLITVVSLMQVIVRNIEVIPSLTWAEEFCRFCWIGSVFLSMAVGLAAGMGYLGLAALLTLVIGLASVLLVSLPVGRGSMNGRELKVTSRKIWITRESSTIFSQNAPAGRSFCG